MRVEEAAGDRAADHAAGAEQALECGNGGEHRREERREHQRMARIERSARGCLGSGRGGRVPAAHQPSRGNRDDAHRGEREGHPAEDRGAGGADHERELQHRAHRGQRGAGESAMQLGGVLATAPAQGRDGRGARDEAAEQAGDGQAPARPEQRGSAT